MRGRKLSLCGSVAALGSNFSALGKLPLASELLWAPRPVCTTQPVRSGVKLFLWRAVGLVTYGIPWGFSFFLYMSRML